MTISCPHCGHTLFRTSLSTMGLTRNQAMTLDAIAELLAKSDGIGPSYQEIADRIGFKSKSAAYRLVMALEQRGYIRMLPTRSRSVGLTEKAKALYDQAAQ